MHVKSMQSTGLGLEDPGTWVSCCRFSVLVSLCVSNEKLPVVLCVGYPGIDGQSR